MFKGKIYFNYPSLQCRRRTSFFYRKEEQNFVSKRMDPEKTLASIVTVKLAMESENGETSNIPQELLTAAKIVTYKYKLSHL